MGRAYSRAGLRLHPRLAGTLAPPIWRQAPGAKNLDGPAPVWFPPRMTKAVVEKNALARGPARTRALDRPHVARYIPGNPGMNRRRLNTGWAASTRMRQIRHLLLVTLVVCALPIAAHAQWATSSNEHDWRLTIGGNSYGLLQRVTYFASYGVGGIRTTTICLGPYTANTRLPAAYVAAMMFLPVGATLFLLARLFPQRRGA